MTRYDTNDDRLRPEVIAALHALDEAAAEVDRYEADMRDATSRAIAAREAGDRAGEGIALSYQADAIEFATHALEARKAAAEYVHRLTGRKFAIGRRKDGTHSLRKTTWRL